MDENIQMPWTPSFAAALADWHEAYARHGLRALDARATHRAKVRDGSPPSERCALVGDAPPRLPGTSLPPMGGWNKGVRPVGRSAELAILRMLADLAGKPVQFGELALLMPAQFQRKRIEKSLGELVEAGRVRRIGNNKPFRYVLADGDGA